MSELRALYPIFMTACKNEDFNLTEKCPNEYSNQYCSCYEAIKRSENDLGSYIRTSLTVMFAMLETVVVLVVVLMWAIRGSAVGHVG